MTITKLITLILKNNTSFLSLKRKKKSQKIKLPKFIILNLQILGNQTTLLAWIQTLKYFN